MGWIVILYWNFHFALRFYLFTTLLIILIPRLTFIRQLFPYYSQALDSVYRCRIIDIRNPTEDMIQS